MTRATRGRNSRREERATPSAQDSGAIEPQTASAVPCAGRLLHRSEAAQLLGVSKSTLRRMEGDTLTPVVGPRNVRMFHEEEVRAVVVTRRAQVDRGPERGEMAGAAFDLFEAGLGVIEAVRRLRADPEVIEALYAHWTRLRGMLVLSAETRSEICTTLVGWDDGKLKTEADIVTFLKRWVANESVRQCTQCKSDWACFCRTCAKSWGLREAREQIEEDRTRKVG